MLLQVNAHFEEGETQDVHIPLRTYLTRASYLARHQFLGPGGGAGFSSTPHDEHYGTKTGQRAHKKQDKRTINMSASQQVIIALRRSTQPFLVRGEQRPQVLEERRGGMHGILRWIPNNPRFLTLNPDCGPARPRTGDLGVRRRRPRGRAAPHITRSQNAGASGE